MHVKSCFGVLFWCVLLCMGIMNKVNSANGYTSCVLLTKLHRNSSVKLIMHFLSCERSFQDQWFIFTMTNFEKKEGEKASYLTSKD